MKIAGQFGIILGLSFAGEWLNEVLPFSVPASIYGFVLLFLLLSFRVIRVEQIKETAVFFLEIMPLLFVPAGVGLITSWSVIREIWWQTLLIVIISTIAVMAVSGRVTQYFLRRTKYKKAGESR